MNIEKKKVRIENRFCTLIRVGNHNILTIRRPGRASDKPSPAIVIILCYIVRVPFGDFPRRRRVVKAQLFCVSTQCVCYRASKANLYMTKVPLNYCCCRNINWKIRKPRTATSVELYTKTRFTPESPSPCAAVHLRLMSSVRLKYYTATDIARRQMSRWRELSTILSMWVDKNVRYH